LRRVAASTALRAGAFLPAGFTAALAAGLPTVLTVGLLVLTGVLVTGLAVFLAADGAADLLAVLAAVLLAGLADFTGAFNAGLAFAAGLTAADFDAVVLAAPVLTLAFLATEFLMWPLTSPVVTGLGAPNFNRTGVPPQISSRL